MTRISPAAKTELLRLWNAGAPLKVAMAATGICENTGRTVIRDARKAGVEVRRVHGTRVHKHVAAVVLLLAEGLPNRVIAKRLGTTPQCVRQALYNMRQAGIPLPPHGRPERRKEQPCP